MRFFSVAITSPSGHYRYTALAHSSIDALITAHDAFAGRCTITVRPL